MDSSITHVNNPPEISVVVPSYNEEDNVGKLYDELVQVFPALNVNWEIIFADDGSVDGTWQEILSLHQRDSRVKGVRLSRNFGHQNALWAGLLQASGRAVVMMDSDLQHPPSVIAELLRAWQQGNKIVHTRRLDSKEVSYFKRVSSKLFYRIFSYLSGVKLESGMADFRLLDQQVVGDVLKFREDGLFLRGVVQWVGYPSVTISYHSQDRFSGSSKYTLKKMLKFAKSGIISFSLVPLRLSVLIGFVTALAAFLEMLYVIYVRLFVETAVPGWASAVGILSFLFGILFILLGVIGEYMGQILIEVRQRPRFLVSDYVGVEQAVQDSV